MFPNSSQSRGGSNNQMCRNRALHELAYEQADRGGTLSNEMAL